MNHLNLRSVLKELFYESKEMRSINPGTPESSGAFANAMTALLSGMRIVPDPSLAPYNAQHLNQLSFAAGVFHDRGAVELLQINFNKFYVQEPAK
jgi:hypothetical protein